MKLLLLSNSTNFGAPYLEHGAPAISSFLNGIKEVLFVPYAAITISYDEYLDRVKNALAPFQIAVRGIHQADDPIAAVNEAEAIMVGGGNTFRLLHMLQTQNLIEPIRNHVKVGKPYIGWSAGSNVAGLSIKTTNDMPVDEPLNFSALQLVPFQINPHFTNDVLPNHNGETRVQRLAEFTVLNPEIPVIGLREGTWIMVNGNTYSYSGKSDYLFLKGNQMEYRTDPIINLS